MITIINKGDCCGCGVCANICLKQCIQMIADDEGFFYPFINKTECIGCGLCEKKCPMIFHNSSLSANSKAYAARNKDISIRNKSSSGGVFFLLAKQYINSGGMVVGSAFDHNFVLRHIIVDNMDGLYQLLGSKYIQSEMGDIYKKIKQNLDSGVHILFSGSSCQVEALLSYLGKKYNNLLTVDLICHGVPSPLLWEKYKQWVSDQFNHAIIDNVFFRDKSTGWHQYSLKITFNNHLAYSKRFTNDFYMKAFLKNYCLRPSCYSCVFKGVNRVSDITLGDFWGIERVVPNLDDNNGTSLVITHSNKGEEKFRQVMDSLEIAVVDIVQALEFNPSALYSSNLPKHREAFMRDLAHNEMDYIYNKYLRDNIIISLINYVKGIKERYVKNRNR